MLKSKFVWLSGSVLFMMSCAILQNGSTTPTLTPETLQLQEIVEIEPPGNPGFASFVWSPDSTQLALTYSETGIHLSNPSKYQIQILDIHSREMQLVEESETGSRDVVAWFPDDRIAFYATNDLENGTWAMQVDGSGTKELLIPGVPTIFSRDLQKISFQKFVEDSQINTWSIFIEELRTEEQEEVSKVTAEGDVSLILGEWAPNGENILFVFHGGGFSPDKGIYILKLKTQDIVKLTQEGEYGSATWSPDGKLIAYTHEDETSKQNQFPPYALYAMRSDGSCPTRLFDPGEYHIGPVKWSPNGRWIAFTWNNGIYLLDTDKAPNIELLKNSSACP